MDDFSMYYHRTYCYHYPITYLLHFLWPISDRHTAQHYLGCTCDLRTRLCDHRNGLAARFTEVAHERGIPFVLARVWAGGRCTEKMLKRRKNGKRLCPICTFDHSLLEFDMDELPVLEF